VERIEAVIGVYPNTEPLFAGPHLAGDVTVEFQDLSTVVKGSVRVAQTLGLDIFEMPVVSYLVAREHGLAVTALPVFVTRQFAHARLVRNRNVGVDHPKDLEGRSFGCRYWGFTDATWARGVLSESFGVDLDRITWITTDDETVPEVVLPPNIERHPDADLVAMLISGEIAGYMLNIRQVIDDPSVGPLIEDVEAAEREWFATTGVLPIYHTVVVRDALLAEHPGLAASLMRAFDDAKAPLLERLDTGAVRDGREQEIAALRDVVGADPFPVGIAANRASLEMLLRLCAEQHLLGDPSPLEDLFVASDG